MSQTIPIRILIADDHELVRSGILAMLEIDPAANLQVVGLAKNGHEMVELFAQLQPDIGLVDLRMPKMGGVDAIAQIRSQFSEARLIILTTYDGDEDIYRGLQAGAKACLLKDTPLKELLQCIQNVHAGRPSLSPDIFQKMMDWQRIQEEWKKINLTERELQVLRLLPTGKTDLAIGAALQIVEGTVTCHISNIFKKLYVNNRVQAIAKGRELGLID